MCCSSQLHKSAQLTHLAHPKPCIRLLFFCCPSLHHTLSAIIIISFYFNFSIIIIISFFVWSPAPQLTRKAAANIIRSFGSVSSFSTSLHFWISFSCSFSSNHSAGTSIELPEQIFHTLHTLCVTRFGSTTNAHGIDRKKSRKTTDTRIKNYQSRVSIPPRSKNSAPLSITTNAHQTVHIHPYGGIPAASSILCEDFHDFSDYRPSLTGDHTLFQHN